MRKSAMTKAEISEQISELLKEIDELHNAMAKLKPGAAIMTLTDAISAAYQDLGVLEYLYHKNEETPTETVVFDEDNQEHAV